MMNVSGVGFQTICSHR